LSHSRHTLLTQQEIERQIRYKLRCVEEGARSARQSLMEQGLSDSVVGFYLMRRIVKGMQLPKLTKDKLNAFVEQHMSCSECR